MEAAAPLSETTANAAKARGDIEIENIIPFGKGGTNDENSRTLLCRAHNHFRAEQEYGRDFTRQKCKSHCQNGGEMTNEVRE